ncbi:MAG: DNA polymerase III subunit delta', partial [Gammaproteobacteria bacterium]
MTEIADPEPVLPSLLPWQTDRWEELVARRRSGRFPHALLLSGPQGIGKRQFAHRVAAALVCDATDPAAAPCGSCRSCRLVRSGTHPDIRWLTPEAEGKAIRVDAVRSLIDQSSLTTQAQGMRVFIVEPADAMNAAAANALLKTLEEPPASSCLLLVSS